MSTISVNLQVTAAFHGMLRLHRLRIIKVWIHSFGCVQRHGYREISQVLLRALQSSNQPVIQCLIFFKKRAHIETIFVIAVVAI